MFVFFLFFVSHMLLEQHIMFNATADGAQLRLVKFGIETFFLPLLLHHFF